MPVATPLRVSLPIRSFGAIAISGPARRVSMMWDRGRARRCARPPGERAGAGDSYFCQAIRCSTEGVALREEQGIVCRLFKLLCEFAPAGSKRCQTGRISQKFPVHFP